MPAGSGAHVHSLARWCSVRLPQARFHPLPSEPDVRISRIRLSSGITHLAHGTPVRSRFQLSPVTRGTSGFACPGSQKLHGFTRGAHLRRAARPVHALTAPSLNPAPSPTHVMLRNSLPLQAGFIGKATPAGLRPSVIPPHPRPLSSTGITPRVFSPTGLSATLPARPAPRGVPVAAYTAPGRASRVAALSILRACRRHYPGGNRPVLSPLSSRPAVGLPLCTGGPASAFIVSRPARRSLAFRPAWPLSRPGRPFCPECFSPCRYLH